MGEVEMGSPSAVRVSSATSSSTAAMANGGAAEETGAALLPGLNIPI